jgi:predicted PurR-regulated permease PerM
VITLLLFGLGLGFLYVARQTLIAFLFAIFFAYLMSPLVSYLEKLLHGRGRAIAVIYVLLLGLVVLFFISMGPRIGREGARLTQSLPALAQLSSGQIAEQLGQQHGWNSRLVDLLRDYLASHGDEIAKLAQGVGLRVADVAKQAWLLVVVPLLSIFFLKDGRAFSEVVLDLVQSRPQRELLQGVLSDLNQMLAHFIRAQLTLAGLTFVMYSAVLAAMQVQYALVLGTVGGLLEFIPVVGPLVAAIIIMGVAALMGYGHWLALIVFLGIWRLIQDYVSFAPHHGTQHGTASAGGNFWSDGWRRDRGNSWHFSFDSGDGECCGFYSGAGGSMRKSESSVRSTSMRWAVQVGRPK